MIRRVIQYVLCGFLLGLVSGVAEGLIAQTDFNGFRGNRGAQYTLGDKDEILMQVNIWGRVKNPGQYLVPRHTDLVSLISFAGGPIDGANLGSVRIIRDSPVMGNGKNGHNGNVDGNNGTHASPPSGKMIKVDVNRFLKDAHTNVIPLLRVRDTVYIPANFGYKMESFLGIGSIFGIIAFGASLSLIIERLR